MSVAIISRISQKNGSLTFVHISLIFLRQVLEASSRVLLTATWLYVTLGQFCPWTLLLLHYSLLAVLVLFHLAVTTSTLQLRSGKYWIGGYSMHIRFTFRISIQSQECY